MDPNGKKFICQRFNDLWKNEGLRPQNEIQNTKTISSTTNKLNPNLKTENHMPFDFLDGNYSTHSIPDFGFIASLGTLLPITQGEDYEEQVFANQIKEKTKRNNQSEARNSLARLKTPMDANRSQLTDSFTFDLLSNVTFLNF
jgi:hypothetical protein